MTKSLDGIKKLNPADLEKYRKIVLNYIGEKDSAGAKEKKVSNQGASSLRKVDGLYLNKINRLTARGGKILKKLSDPGGWPDVSLKISPLGLTAQSTLPNLSGRADASDNQKDKLANSRERETKRLQEAIRRQAEAREKIKEEERQYQIKKDQAQQDRRARAQRLRREKINLEKDKIKQEKIKQAEFKARQRALEDEKFHEQQELIRRKGLMKNEIAEQAKRQAAEIKLAEAAKRQEEKIKLEKLAIEEKIRIKENARLEKLKRKKEIKRIKLEIKAAKQAAKEKKRIKRQKARKRFKRSFKLRLNYFFSKIKKNIIYAVSLSIILLAIAYLVFCLAVLKLKIDNNFIGQAANYLPVPAAITSQGIITYHDYKKIVNKNYLSLSLLEKKNYLAEWVILGKLRDKYGLAADAPEETLAIKYVMDKDFNQTGLSRINKINEMLKNRGGIESSGQYADEYNGEVYYDANSAAEKFGPAVFELAVGQTSGVIPRADGYYIIKIIDKNGQLGLKYIFIQSQTLVQYVSEKLGKIKVFILAD